MRECSFLSSVGSFQGGLSIHATRMQGILAERACWISKGNTPRESRVARKCVRVFDVVPVEKKIRRDQKKLLKGASGLNTVRMEWYGS